MLAAYTLFYSTATNRVALVAQQVVPPVQNADDPLGELLNEEAEPETTADENAPPRSILDQLIDFMSDNEFVGFPDVTGYTAKYLDKQENKFVKIVQSNPNL